MRGFFLVIVAVSVLTGCQRRAETAKSDLGEAGYKLTAEDWFRASRGNDVTAMKRFLAGGFSADTRNAEGDSALHAAAVGGAQGAADLLLKRGLATDLRGAAGRTPLMAAVIADQTAMVRWLLRQGAGAGVKDDAGFKPLMLAVREGKPGSVAELAAYDRKDLDPALLLAALVGRADVIDALTNFGASVYARMEDGRTPLMIAAENGHAEAVKLLLDIGASRFTTDPEGHTAAELATAAGHPEIAALISRDPLPSDLALESPVEIAASMDASVDAAKVKSNAPAFRQAVAIPLEGETLSAAPQDEAPFPLPPLAMRFYREKEVPLQVRSVQGGAALVTVNGSAPHEMKLRAGDPVPGSSLVVLQVRRRMEDSKVNLGAPSEISVLEVRDRSTGVSREWISGLPSHAHDPAALLEDTATGKRYVASPGQRFRAAGGAEFLILEIRPNQMVIQEIASGAVRTIPLRGPLG